MDFHPTGHPAGPLPCPADTTDLAGALAALVAWLRCPLCAGPLQPAPSRALRCPRGHIFDIARQGYVSLLAGRRPHRGDTAAMIAARERFLGGDHYRPLRSTITALATAHAPVDTGLVTDLAGGTGHYLAAVLDAVPGALGLVLDVSTAALRRAARAHPRAGAVAVDLRGPVPVASGAAGVVLSVFGPRPPGEIVRLLHREGVLVLASARPGHLRELRHRPGAPRPPGALGAFGGRGTLGVDPRKGQRLREAFGGFEVLDDQPVDWRLALTRPMVADLVTMGPSGHHLDTEAVRAVVDDLPEISGVTAAMSVTVLRPRR